MPNTPRSTATPAEMRRTLGTAVFAGMLGVTLFGIFLTPVFYYVIQWLKDGRGATLAVEPAVAAHWQPAVPPGESPSHLLSADPHQRPRG